MGVTQEGVNLRDEVFNYVPGTVNTTRVQQLQFSWSSFFISKACSIQDRSNWPDLESDVAGSGAPTSSQLPPYSSTPFHGSSQVPLNQTFDISGIPPANLGNAQNTATIAAEVSAAAAAQASKEFRQMWELKLPSCAVDILLMQSSCSGPGERTLLLTSRTGSWITKWLSDS